MQRNAARLTFIVLAGILLVSGLDAQAARYPREWRWKTFESGNIEVYYPSEYTDHARYLALRGHVWLDSLYEWYGEPTERARITLLPDNDRGRALAVINPTRIELPAMPALDKGLRPQSALYLDRVSAHELTHVYQMDRTNGLTSALRPIFGESIAPVALAPDWLLEGQAIWTESMGGGGRLNSSYTSMQFRAEIAQAGNIWPLDHFAVRGGVNPPLNRAYTGGTYLYGSLASEFRAKDSIRDWMRRQAAWPGFTGSTFRAAYNNRTLIDQHEALESAWRAQLRGRMNRRYELGYSVGDRLLEAKRTSYRHPEWTADGELLVAETSYSDPPRLVHLYGPLKGRMQPYADRGHTAHDGIAPLLDGVITSETRRGFWQQGTNSQVLVRLTADGRITDLSNSPVRGWAPAWHADTQQLSWIAPTETGASGLYHAPTDLRGLLKDEPELLLATSLGSLNDPAWSPDGGSIAFAAELGNGERVVVLDLETGDLTEISFPDAPATWDPSFAPDGSLWVSADVVGIFDLFQVDLAEDVAFRQTRVLTGAVEPAVSEDGVRVAYSHYTREGFSVALLDSSRWLRQPVDVRIAPLDRTAFAATDSLLDSDVFGVDLDYSPLHHLAPNYAVPELDEGDELAAGISVIGRDPLGLLSWSLDGRWGFESNEPHLGGAVTYRDLPVNLSLRADSYPDEVVGVASVTAETVDEPDTSYTRYLLGLGDTWRRSHDVSLLAFQPLALDRGRWTRTLTPFVGIVGRFREVHDPVESLIRAIDAGTPVDELGGVLDDSWELRSAVGVRVGASYLALYSARRDPVPSHLVAAGAVLERALPDADLYADLIQVNGRWHTPAPWTNTVFALQGAVQLQNGDFAYSRSVIRPRGYGVNELPLALTRNGRFLFSGGEFHFPPAFVDDGLGSIGNIFLERINGALFVEGTTGWGGGESLEHWARQQSAVSMGGELTFRGWLLFQAETELTLGAAYRPQERDSAFYFTLSFPELYSFVNDQSERDTRLRHRGWTEQRSRSICPAGHVH